MAWLDSLAEIELETDRGEALRLCETWRERPAVLVFLRHFG